MTGRIVRLLENAGRDAAAVCRRAGVSLEEVSNPESRVPYRLSDALVEACVARRALVTKLDLRSSADEEIAFLVGFSDPSALTRARARWASGG